MSIEITPATCKAIINAYEEMTDDRLPDGNGYDYEIAERLARIAIEASGLEAEVARLKALCYELVGDPDADYAADADKIVALTPLAKLGLWVLNVFREVGPMGHYVPLAAAQSLDLLDGEHEETPVTIAARKLLEGK